MIYVYVFSIVLVAILIILLFVIMNKKHEKSLKSYKKEKHDKQVQIPQEEVVQEEIVPIKEEAEPVYELEDFVWDKKKQVANQEATDAETAETEENLDDYEKFLKENNIETDMIDDGDDGDLGDEDLEFDFNELIGKTNEEIAEIIKKYPPEVQEIVMQELANDEDDE